MTEQFNPFASGEILRLCPTTGPQQELIASAQFSDEANTAFNEAVSIRIDGPLDVELLAGCLDVLVERHELLRATFSRNGREICLQSLLRPKLECQDWSSLSPEQQAQSLDDLWKNIALSPMNLEEGPLLFAWLLKYEPRRHELVIAAHHVICDGWSFGLLLTEWATLYRSQKDPSSLPARESFLEFAEQNDALQVRNADIDFWRNQFRSPPPTLDLPLDFSRPKQRTFTAKRFDFQMNTELVAALPRAAAKIKASLVQTVLAGYFALLHRLTRAEDIVVGLPVAGQAAMKRLHQFGHMVQLLPIRVSLDENTPFVDVVTQVRSNVLSASEHPNFTFGNLIEGMQLDRSRVPLIATMFNIDQPMGELDFGPCKGSLRTVPRAAENFELFLNFLQDPGQLTIEATYSTTLFAEDSVRSWLESLECLLEQAILSPQTSIGDFALCRKLSPIQVRTNATATSIANPDLVRAFREQVQRTPTAVAIATSATSITYQQLEHQSNAFAALMAGKGVTEGAIVGICCERSERMVIAAIAILKLGASYLPLDPDFPADRLVYMLEDSGATAVVEDDAAPQVVRGTSMLHLDLKLLDGLLPQPEFVLADPSSERLAYIIYTSGSTGKPKGVRIPNRAMINFLESMVREPGCGANDCLLAVTTLSFDISVLELFVPLITGARVVVASRSEAKDGEQLTSLLRRHHATILQATPATWRVLLASSWMESVPDKPLRALCGGEPLPPDLIAELLPRVGELWNMFGPTETTVWSTCKKITNTTSLVTVGKPIANTQLYLLDRRNQPLPIAAPGELCIGGDGLALGYHKRAELTAEKFTEVKGIGRVYRTGDLAKVLPNGELQHLGRLDDQVKLRGYRIELGEIESALKACDTVQAAAAYLWELAPQDVRLVACCVCREGSELATSAIRKRLRESLPAYMVPQYLLPVETIPLTPNGKVNRRALPRPELAESKMLSKAELCGPMEELIAGVWTSLVRPKNPIGREDNFFEIGGHSLLALEAIRQIEKSTGTRLTPRQIVSERLHALAEKLGANKTETVKGGPEVLSATEARQLSKEQMRILQRQLDYPATTCNNLPAAWVIRGRLDVKVFSRSLQKVMERQTALRTLIRGSDGNYQQVLLHHLELKLPEFVDLRGEANPFERALEDANARAAQPFHLLNQLLFRARLYQVDEQEFFFVVVPHQIVFDGWSFDLLLGELAKVYSALIQGATPELAPLPFEFRDYSHWHGKRQPDQKTLEFHRRALPAMGTNAKERGMAERIEWRCDGDALARVERFCDTNQLRLHEYLFAAFAVAMFSWHRRPAATLGFPVTGRYNPDVIGQIGSFVSILPCQLVLEGSDFAAQAKSITGQIKTFLEHQDLTLGELSAGGSAGREAFPSFMEASLGFQDIRNRPTGFADLELRQVDMPRLQTELPMEFWVRVQRDGHVAVLDFDSSITNRADLKELETLLLPYLHGLPHQGHPAAANVVQADAPDAVRKPLWRRLFG
jgi:amino acid adenylation domain-containing protein